MIMGTVQSRFHELLLEGRVEESLLMWIETEQLQTRFDPKAIVRGRWRDPPLHCLLRHGDYKHTQLKVLAVELLERKADPLMPNSNKETALHIVCTSERHSKRVSQARRDMLDLLMEYLPDNASWLELADAVSVLTHSITHYSSTVPEHTTTPGSSLWPLGVCGGEQRAESECGLLTCSGT